jgi:hypothetical protein
MNAISATRSVMLLLLVASLIVGCGEPKLGEVSGTITYDGKIVEQGSIAFIPVDGKGPTAGSAIKDGKYLAQKVSVGTAKIRIMGAKVTGQKKMFDDPDSPLVTTSEEYLPCKYNKQTELTFDVLPGVQIKDFDLAR